MRVLAPRIARRDGLAWRSTGLDARIVSRQSVGAKLLRESPDPSLALRAGMGPSRSAGNHPIPRWRFGLAWAVGTT